jgi:UDP-3-O-[3-hydroxymyristoyl] glucosamine N-acyltransferase
MEERATVPSTIQQLADLVQGRITGDAQAAIHGARTLQEAGPDDVSFVESDRHLKYLPGCRARALVVPANLPVRPEEFGPRSGSPPVFILVSDALAAFCTIAQHLHGQPEEPPSGIDPRAAIHPQAQIGPDPSIHPFAVVGAGSVLGARCRIHSGVVIGKNCRIGDNVTLYPHVVLYDGVIVGNRVTIHASTVIGADGFGYRLQDGRHVKVPQLGHVEIGDDVEIGASATIDRGTFQATRIGAGTKIDNLVMIAHNCQIGRHNLFVSQVGVAGSSITGDYVVLAGQVGVADHVHIHDRAVVGARSGLFRDVPAGERMLGVPARSEREEKRILLSREKLPELCRDVRNIKRHLGLGEGNKEEAA